MTFGNREETTGLGWKHIKKRKRGEISFALEAKGKG